VTLDARTMPVSDGYRMQTIDCLPHSAGDTDPASANAPQGHTS
jgi:outer membrane usher protein